MHIGPDTASDMAGADRQHRKPHNGSGDNETNVNSQDHRSRFFSGCPLLFLHCMTQLFAIHHLPPTLLTCCALYCVINLVRRCHLSGPQNITLACHVSVSLRYNSLTHKKTNAIHITVHIKKYVARQAQQSSTGNDPTIHGSKTPTRPTWTTNDAASGADSWTSRGPESL